MNPTTIVGLMLIMASSAVAQQPAKGGKTGAKVNGIITMFGGDSPVVGAGVTILNKSDYRFVTSTITEPDGKYEVGELTSGTGYFVKFCHDKFTPVFAEVTAPTTKNMTLNPRTETLVYWGKKADSLTAGKAVNHVSFGGTWEHLFDDSPVSPEGKAQVARVLKERGAKPELWGKDRQIISALFVAYSKADPMTLNTVEQALWSNETVSPGLDPLIIADIQAQRTMWQPVLRKQSPSDPCGDPYFPWRH